ncbi:MAG: trypsin-like serine protease [Deltaproteobacteria bacterium]|nr:trypsin-like serine protease [Deltaproteobacteria bacterium]
MIERPRTGSLIVLFALLQVSCSGGQQPSALRQAIVGGDLAAPNTLPSIGALVSWQESRFRAFCTATLISDQLALTAAHCIESRPQSQPMALFFGRQLPTATSSVSGTLVDVRRRYTHPNYDRSIPNDPRAPLGDLHDIAVLELADPVSLTPMRMVSSAAAVDLLQVGQAVTVAGFGRSEANNLESSGDKRVGASTIGLVGPSEFWLTDEGGLAQKCVADSGSPTLAGEQSDDTLVILGVAARAGENCTGGSVETRVDKHLEWIHGFGPLPCSSGLSAACQPPAKPLGLGARCYAGSHCQSGSCLPTSSTQRTCTQACDDQTPCPEHFACRTTSAPAVCVPLIQAGGLGASCDGPEDCLVGYCHYSAQRNYCSRLCKVDLDCTDQLICASTTEGQQQCMLPEDAPNSSSQRGCQAVGAAGQTPTTIALLLALLVCARLRRRVAQDANACKAVTGQD